MKTFFPAVIAATILITSCKKVTEITKAGDTIIITPPATAAYITTAKRILDASAKGGLPVVMAIPPTITVGIANAPSSISDGYITNADSPLFTVWGTKAQVWNVGYTPSPNLLFASSVTAQGDGRVKGAKTGEDLRIVFNTNAPVFEFGALCSVSPGNGYRIWVNDQPTSLLTRTDVKDDSGYRYIKVDFGAAGTRKITIEFEKYIAFGGVRVGANYNIWPVELQQPLRFMLIGDSYTDGVGATSFLTGYARTVGQLLGVSDTWVNGEGNLGYLGLGISSGLYARQKLASDVIAYKPDWVTVAFGINDAGKTPSLIQNEATIYLKELLAGLPNTGVTVIGPWRTPGVNPPQQVADAIKAAAVAQPEYGTRLMYIDTFGENWQQVAGNSIIPYGTGNSNLYITADNVHPNQAGHDYIAQRVFLSVIKHLKSVTK